VGDEILGMSRGERERSHAVRMVIGKGLGQRQAAELLGICVRQMKRLVRSYRAQGDAGLVSKQRGRVSPRRLDGERRAKIVELLRGKYEGFGPTLAAEKLGELEGLEISRESVRRLQMACGLWKPKRRKAKRVFRLRERRPRFGELIQIDGSPHDWFEGRAPRCVLIVFIDDATGRLTALHMATAETTRAYIVALRRHVQAFGRPLALYSDRHGVFRVNAKEAESGDGKTEFNRVTDRLNIEQICARTPQAKGRVERANQTLQDRLIKEMRLAGVASIAAAEAFFPGFIAKHNVSFAVAPRDAEDAHRPLALDAAALEEVLARREERVLTKALTFSCGGVKYAVATKGPGLALRGARITLLHFADGSMRARFKDRELSFTAYGRSGVPAALEDEKTIDARLDAIVASLPRSPPAPTSAAAT